MASSERKYQKLFEEAQADAIRLRKERDALAGWLETIGWLSNERNVKESCRNGLGGNDPPDTARLDAVERECADVELTCGGVWRVSGVDDYEGDSLREAIDRMMAANPWPAGGHWNG
jgi:hypothetical protein